MPRSVAAVDRRVALVDATFHAIARNGFEGLRLREVAAVAGIDHSTVHHYFPTKQDLIEAVVQRATAPLQTTIPPGSSPRRRLDGHLRSLAEMIQTDPELFVVLAEIDLRARRDPEIRAIIDRVEQGWRSGLEPLLDGDPTKVEIVIAVVKGVRLDPVVAPDVLHRLAVLLAAQHADREETNS